MKVNLVIPNQHSQLVSCKVPEDKIKWRTIKKNLTTNMLVLYIYFHPFHCFLFFLKILFQYYCSGISKDKKTIEIKQNSDNQGRYSLTSKIKVDKIVWWWWKRRQWYWLMMMEKETMQHRIIAFLACKKWSNKYKLMTHKLTLQLNVALICASFVYVYLFFDFLICFFCKKISKVWDLKTILQV